MTFNGSSNGSSVQQNAQHDYYNQLPLQQQQHHHQQQQQQSLNSLEGPDSDSGLEVLEEATLKPSDLIRGNHNRSMSIISGKCRAQISRSFQGESVNGVEARVSGENPRSKC